MTRFVRVGDIRRIIAGLPNNAMVKVDERMVEYAGETHDGRYGPVLYLRAGDYVHPFGNGAPKHTDPEIIAEYTDKLGDVVVSTSPSEILAAKRKLMRERNAAKTAVETDTNTVSNDGTQVS